MLNYYKIGKLQHGIEYVELRAGFILNRLLIFLGLFYSCFSVWSQSSKPTVAVQLKLLAEHHGFELRGVEKAGASYQSEGSGEVGKKVQRLLADFNHVVIHNDDGSIEKVIILKQKAANTNQIVLDTKRKGNHHIVQATIVGHESRQFDVSFLVDTGADFVVLPETMIADLGIDPESLEEQQLQTANGSTKARIGQLQAVILGGELIKGVKVAFLEDAQLGGVMLLGMNVLRQYRMTIDDLNNVITLIKN